MANIRIKRIYDAPSKEDGYRILVDRLWPRGITHERAKLDAWMKDITPSPDLRKWFGHLAANFKEFSVDYVHELSTAPEKIAAVNQVLDIAEAKPVTLLYAARDPAINHAIVLLHYLEEKQALRRENRAAVEAL